MSTRRTVLQACLLVPALACARPLRVRDQVTVFPTVAHRDANGGLVIRIEAWVFEREYSPTRTRLLARSLGLDLDQLSVADRQRFIARAALFGADAKDGRELMAYLPGRAAVALPRSDEQGRVRAALPYAAAVRAGQWIDWTVGSGLRRFASRAQWLGDEGVSVISDIDDTIKHTLVRQHREMLLNTFAREFSAVPGMAAWFGGIARASNNVAFHYVSGSPLQLMPPLGAFLRGSGFPDGSVHLRAFSLNPTSLLDSEATSRHKQAEITQLLTDHPQRRFLLVGDSGERDPETYGAIAREHPSRIAEILIRDVTGEDATAPRYAQAFADVPRERWRLFTDPTTLPLRWA
jgi:hypothetical protein